MNTNEQQNEVDTCDEMRELIGDELNVVGGGRTIVIGSPGANQ
jgi:hypothetical protein